MRACVRACEQVREEGAVSEEEGRKIGGHKEGLCELSWRYISIMDKADVCIVKAKVKFREVMKEASRGQRGKRKYDNGKIERKKNKGRGQGKDGRNETDGR